jgi:hypothetical protein
MTTTGIPQTQAARLLAWAWYLGVDMALRADVDEWHLTASDEWVWLSFVHGEGGRKAGVKLRIEDGADADLDAARAYVEKALGV